MSFQRDFIEGACNEPQPYNWRSACRLRSGHSEEHRAPVIGGRVYRWTDDAMWAVRPGRASVVRYAKRLGRRHYVKPASIGRAA